MTSLNSSLKYKIKDDADLPKTLHLQRKCTWPLSFQYGVNLFNAIQYRHLNSVEYLTGFYTAVINSQIIFEGLLKDSQRFGPGILTFSNSLCQNIGWWHGPHIVRLCQVVCPNRLPTISKPQSFPKTTNADWHYNHNVVDILRKYNMQVNLATSIESTEDVVADDIETSVFDLEAVLRTRGSNTTLMIEPYQRRTDMTIYEFDMLLNFASTETTLELLKHTLPYCNQEMTYDFYQLLRNERSVFGKPSIYEKACVDSLSACSSGETSYFNSLRSTFHINTNICDGRGNVGLMYAAARDKIEMIKQLALHGANFNMYNDEGLNPLCMVLLRFIALLRKIKNWHTAFVRGVNTPSSPRVRKCSRNVNLLPFDDVKFYYKDHRARQELPIRLKQTINEIVHLYGLYLPAPTIQNFQSIYIANYCNTKKCQDWYIFDFRFRKQQPIDSSKKTHRKQGQFQSRRIQNSTFLNLTVVFNTIVILLHYGSDPTIGTCPLPAIFLGLFTESGDVINMLLRFGADPCTRLQSYHNITVLHALVSMPPGKYMLNIGRELLMTQVDLNARTEGSHWCEERQWAVGTGKVPVDTGKTALHILTMRVDLDWGSSCLKQLMELLIEKGASLTERYLGHVPLTLAMLRGNQNAVQILLKNGANGNEPLGKKMGSPVTLYLLQRFKEQLPPFDTCKCIVQALLRNGGDPLKMIDSYHNAFEFLDTEKHPITFGRSSKSFGSRCRMRPTRFTRDQLKIRQLLLANAHRRIVRHNKCLAFIAIYFALRDGLDCMNDLGFQSKCSHFLSLKRALKIADCLTFLHIINPAEKSDRNTLWRLLEFVCKDLNETKNSEDIIKQIQPVKPDAIQPEFDTDFDKYKVCFACCLKTGKELLTCPSCGLVQFCSARCEKFCKNRKIHSCRTPFYVDEYKQYTFCKHHNIRYEAVHDEVFDNIRKILQNMTSKLDSNK